MRDPEATVAPRRTLVRSHMVLVAIAVVFLIARSPTMLRQAGALDEDFFAMPGWTAATEGIPRLPIYPSRDRLGNFYKADVALFTLPPAFFYWQAPWHLAIGPGYSAARFGSATAGIISLWLVYALGRRWYGCELTALVAAGLLSCSRYFFFPATTARPDMLCTMLCLAAYWGMTAWSEDRRGGWAAFAGAFSGLAVLAHPFGAVAATQIGCWALLGHTTWRKRLVAAALVVFGFLAALATWLPLILAFPEEFRTQFMNNVVHPQTTGLIERFVMLAPVVARQWPFFVELGNPIQAMLALAGLAGATWLDARRRGGPRVVVALAWSSLYLLMVMLGTHPWKHYLSLPAALLFLCVARVLVVSAGAIARRWAWRPAWPLAASVIGVIALMMPGYGLRAWATYVAHWNDIDYDCPRFVERMMAELPADAVYLVDQSYVFPVWLTGRKTYLLTYVVPEIIPDSDYLIVAPQGLEWRLHEQFAGDRERTFGTRESIFACYAEVFDREGMHHQPRWREDRP